MKMEPDIRERVRKAKRASIVLAAKSTEDKDRALEAMARALDSSRERILEENAKDVSDAEGMVSRGELSKALLKRLIVTDQKIDTMVLGIRDVISLPDPVGKTMDSLELDSGLELYQISSPIGLIGVIFESRPDVIPQIMALCLKSGNATAFKGGSEASRSNRILFDVLVEAISSVEGMPGEAFHQIAESVSPYPPSEAGGLLLVLFKGDHLPQHLVGLLASPVRSVGRQSHHLVFMLELAHPQEKGDQAVEAAQRTRRARRGGDAPDSVRAGSVPGGAYPISGRVVGEDRSPPSPARDEGRAEIGGGGMGGVVFHDVDL